MSSSCAPAITATDHNAKAAATPVDRPQVNLYSRVAVQQEQGHGREQVRHPPGHPRPDGPADPRGDGAAARLRHRPRIEQISEDVLQLNQGTIYASLLRLQQRRWISASWGTSENNRKAKFYAITRTGRKQLAAQAQNWERISAVMMRLLRLAQR